MKRIYIGLMMLGMMACNQLPESSIEIVKVDVNSSDYLEEEAVFKNFDFVKLETTPESLLSDVSKILVGEDRLYVLPMMDPRVFIFSKEGKYINSLKKGEGPGEIRFVYDMDATFMYMIITVLSASTTRTATIWKMSIHKIPITC